MALKPIKQSQFLKGVNASVAYNSQPKGTVPRISNMVFTNRGAMRSADQNLGICTLNGAGPAAGEGPIVSTQFFQPTSSSRKVLSLQRDFDTPLAVPTSLTATLAAGGTLTLGQPYYYEVTAIDGIGGETTTSNEVTATPSGGNRSISLAWTAVPGAFGYNVYRGTSTGTETRLVGAGLPASTNSYIDTGAATNAAVSFALLASPNGASRTLVNTIGGRHYYLYSFTTTVTPTGFTNGTQVTTSGVLPADLNVVSSFPSYPSLAGNTISFIVTSFFLMPNETGGGGTIAFGAGVNPPLANTTQTLSLIDMSNLTYSKPTSVIKTFPTGQFPPIAGFPPGSVGGGFSGGSSGATNNPSCGGILGQSCPIPDMVPFVGMMMIILGNGLPPYQSDGTTGGTIPLANTFTGAFPGWVASTAYSVGDIIQPDTPNGHVYICIQGGISNTTIQPAFPTSQGQTVNDGSGSSAIIWQEHGSNATPAPRGAAHAISHAGSLWLWNTYPTTTSDLLDGPSVLKMSDANQPNSWNPINTAFVGKDDGQQGMGMASFTIAESGIPPEGSLVLFKEFSTYQVIGVFGATDFAIQKAQTDLGCIAPRTIKFVPGFGIVRLTHLGVAVFDGVRDRLISEEIRPYLFGDIGDIQQMDFSWAYAAKGDVTAVPPMYVMAIPVLGGPGNGSLTRLCCFDLVLKAWSIIDLPFGIEALRQLLIPGGEPLTVFGGYSDAMLSRWQVGDQQGWQAWLDNSLQAHQGTPLTWNFRTPSALGAEASDRIMFRRLIVRGIWQGVLSMGAGQPPIAVNTTGTTAFSILMVIDKGAVPTGPARPIFTPTGGVADSSFELVTEIGRTGLDAYATVSGTQALNGSPVEIVECDWHAVARPIGALARV